MQFVGIRAVCCKECNVKGVKDFYARYPEKMRIHHWFGSCRNNALKRGVVWNITKTMVTELWNQQDGLCALSGLPLRGLAEPREKTGHVSWNSASIDRILPELGYVPGNVRLVLFCVNALRGVMKDADMLAVAKGICQTMEKL